LLHGLAERGKRIYRKLKNHLPQDALIIAPNAPFPMSEGRDMSTEGKSYSWYFYNKEHNTYLINQDLAKYWLRDLLIHLKVTHLPLTLIGFSQGGYLAPLVGLNISQTRLVIGLACEFRHHLLPSTLPFKSIQIHGEEDDIIPITDAKREFVKLKENGNDIEFIPVPGTQHEISDEMGQIVGVILRNYGN
jgi:predicted esterase